jgi:DNA invertase Pin-like site-specific DNA recombinase
MGILGIYVRTSIDTDGTSIDQQKQVGIQFSEKNNYQYQVYEDEGKSGFKIEDDNNPFKNRKGLLKLISDIENKLIDKVWVYEHSRLSRNQYSSYVLFRIFEKHNITVYENDKVFNMNDPQSQMVRGILDSVAQYERELIISRTTRGLYDSINKGKKGYKTFYGYKKTGRNASGLMLWKPVESEIENIKFAYNKFLSGAPVKSIVKEIHNNDSGELAKKWVRIFKRFEYTGYSLTMEGLEIYNKFKCFELDSLKELNNEKYFIKSATYPLQIVSIDNWLTVVEKLQDNKKMYKDKMRKINTGMLTGIIQCPYCNMRYFRIDDKGYKYYKHQPLKCSQRPKSMHAESVENIFSIFFFYFYLVFDDTKILIKESQRIIKLNQLELKEKIKDIDTENRKLVNQIDRFGAIYESSNDNELLKLTLIKETELNNKKESNNLMLGKFKSELEELNRKFNNTELELTYYDIKEKIISFFEKLSVDDKRQALVKIINKCQLFNKYLVIDTGEILFLFNIKEEYILPESIYSEFKNDLNFKENFLTPLFDDNIKEFSKTPIKEAVLKYSDMDLIDIDNKIVLHLLVRRLGNITIKEYYLEKNKVLIKEKFNNLKFSYDLTSIEKIVSFTSDF